MNDSVIACDEIIGFYDDETKTIPTIFSEKKAICRTRNLYILLAFLLITIALTVCSYHVTYAFRSESTLYSCLNVKELLA